MYSRHGPRTVKQTCTYCMWVNGYTTTFHHSATYIRSPCTHVLTVLRPYLMYTCGYVHLHYKLRVKHMYVCRHELHRSESRWVHEMRCATSIHKHTPHRTTYTTRAHTYVPTHALKFICRPPHTIHTHIHSYTYTHSAHAHDTVHTHNHPPLIPNIHHKVYKHHKINIHHTIHIWTTN